MDSNVLGIDLGGTKTAVCRYNALSWRDEAAETIPTDTDAGLEKILSDMMTLIDRYRTPETRAIGIGVPGLVRQPDGVLLKTPNIPHFENIEIKRIMSEKTGLDVYVENDATCFALAEATLGAGKDKSVVVGINMGTGVGGGIIINGKVFQGAHGYAAEIGHMLLVPGHPPFKTKDKRGDVEQFLSGTSMGLRLPKSVKPEDYLSGEFLSNVITEVAWMCASLTHLLDPSIIIFNGSAGRALEPHLSAISSEIEKWVLHGSPIPELAIADFEEAGTLGAALLAA